MGRWSRGRIALVALAVLVINVPYVGHLFEEHKLTSDGVHVTAAVVSATRSGGDVIVGFKLPADVDAKQEVRTAAVDGATGLRARVSRQIGVTVLRGNPGVFRADGQTPSHGPLIVTLVADIALIGVVLLALSGRGQRRRPPLEAVALADVVHGEEGSLLDKQSDGSYLIEGQVDRVEGEILVLALRDRAVTVHLRGYDNAVAVGECARVHAHLVG